jgi:hypothetical protein
MRGLISEERTPFPRLLGKEPIGTTFTRSLRSILLATRNELGTK